MALRLYRAEEQRAQQYSPESLRLEIPQTTSEYLAQIAQQWADSPRVLISDIDEVIFLSTEKHYALWNKRFRDDLQEEVSYELFCELGGTVGVYANSRFLSQEKIELFKKMLEFVVAAPKFNRGLPLVHPELPQILEGVDQFFPLAFYLSTRPEGISQLTYEELLSHSLPDRQVFARPSTVDGKYTNQWKAAILQEFAKYYPGEIYLMDDSGSQYEFLLQQDQSVAENRRIHPILFAGQRTPSHYLEKYPHVSWESVTEALKRETKVIYLR